MKRSKATTSLKCLNRKLSRNRSELLPFAGPDTCSWHLRNFTVGDDDDTPSAREGLEDSIL